MEQTPKIDNNKSLFGSNLNAQEGMASQRRLELMARLRETPNNEELQSNLRKEETREALLRTISQKVEDYSDRQIAIAERIVREITSLNAFGVPGEYETLDFSGEMDHPTLAEVCGVFGLNAYNGDLHEAVQRGTVTQEGGRYNQRFVVGVVEVPVGNEGKVLKAQISFVPIHTETHANVPHAITVRPA